MAKKCGKRDEETCMFYWAGHKIHGGQKTLLFSDANLMCLTGTKRITYYCVEYEAWVWLHFSSLFFFSLEKLLIKQKAYLPNDSQEKWNEISSSIYYHFNKSVKGGNVVCLYFKVLHSGLWIM